MLWIGAGAEWGAAVRIRGGRDGVVLKTVKRCGGWPMY